MTQSSLDHTLMTLPDPTRRAILQRLAEGNARLNRPGNTEKSSAYLNQVELALPEQLWQLARRKLAGNRRNGSLTTA